MSPASAEIAGGAEVGRAPHLEDEYHGDCVRESAALREMLRAEQDLSAQLRRGCAEEQRARIAAERRLQVQLGEAEDRLEQALQRVRRLGEEAERAKGEVGEARRRAEEDERRRTPWHELEARLEEAERYAENTRHTLEREREDARRASEEARKEGDARAACLAAADAEAREWEGRARAAEKAIARAKDEAGKAVEAASQASDALRAERGTVLSLRDRIARMEENVERTSRGEGGEGERSRALEERLRLAEERGSALIALRYQKSPPSPLAPSSEFVSAFAPGHVKKIPENQKNQEESVDPACTGPMPSCCRFPAVWSAQMDPRRGRVATLEEDVVASSSEAERARGDAEVSALEAGEWRRRAGELERVRIQRRASLCPLSSSPRFPPQLNHQPVRVTFLSPSALFSGPRRR